MDKMKMYTLLLSAVCILCIVGAAAALAEDFTFTVPVHLKALDAKITTAEVNCYLDTGQVGRAPGLSPDANGNIDQNVVVKFNAPPDPSKAKAYTCGLKLFGAGVFCDFTYGQKPTDAVCAVKGSLTGSVGGSIPSQ